MLLDQHIEGGHGAGEACLASGVAPGQNARAGPQRASTTRTTATNGGGTRRAIGAPSAGRAKATGTTSNRSARPRHKKFSRQLALLLRRLEPFDQVGV
jgi:hypothetical protein